jgi:hypothetical protein
MEDQLISFETAKLAKERGFNTECVTFYNRGSNYKMQSDPMIRTGYDIIYEAPTQSLLQKWLREKNHIYVAIQLYGNSYKQSYITQIITDLNPNTTQTLYSIYEYYEEALEIGLQEALKLIK